MTTMFINSREALEALQGAGMKKAEAREVVKLIEQIDSSHLATKQDLQTMKSELTSSLFEMKSELIKFMFTQSIATVAIVVALIKIL